MTGLKSKRGYTLTEMLVVIGIIGLLAAALTPVLIGQLGRARVKAAQLQLENISTSLESFRADVGRYPTDAEGLQSLVDEPPGLAGWLGPYVRSAQGLDDPWKNKLRYALKDGRPSVSSLGADAKEGGRSADADLSVP